MREQRPGGNTGQGPVWLRWLQLAATGTILLLIAVFLWTMRGATPQDLLAMAPENYWAAAGWLLLLYLAKSLSVVFPIVVLQLAAGLLFPLPGALAVNLVGALLGNVLGYLVGRLAGRKTAASLLERYPKAGELTRLYEGRELFFTYITRIAGVFPMDVVSILMGSLEVDFGRYLLGTLLGMLPSIVAITLLGSALTEPASPIFWIALACQLLVTAASLLCYRYLMKKQNTK